MAKRKKKRKKEVGAKRGRKLRKEFWIGLGVVVAVVLLIIVLLVVNFGEKTEWEETGVEPGSDEYYDALEEACRQLEQREVGCCITSANVMRGQGYLLAENGECPEGLEQDDLGCAGSYKWCK